MIQNPSLPCCKNALSHSCSVFGPLGETIGAHGWNVPAKTHRTEESIVIAELITCSETCKVISERHCRSHYSEPSGPRRLGGPEETLQAWFGGDCGEVHGRPHNTALK